jgi:hypothetical protein
MTFGIGCHIITDVQQKIVEICFDPANIAFRARAIVFRSTHDTFLRRIRQVTASFCNWLNARRGQFEEISRCAPS